MARPKRAPKAPKITIRAVLDEFLDEQEERLSAPTFTEYEKVLRLLQGYLERYWPDHDGEMDDAPAKKYGDTYGPEEIPKAYYGFFDYYMPNKVICSRGTLRALGPVTKKLATWLGKKGYVEERDAELAAWLSGDKARDLLNSMNSIDATDGLGGGE